MTSNHKPRQSEELLPGSLTSCPAAYQGALNPHSPVMSKPAELTLVVDRDGSTTSPGSVSPRHVIPSQTEDETLSALPAPLIAAEPAQSQQSPRKNPQHGRTAAPSKKPDKAKTSTPYRSSPAISERSISQGNLLETESIGGSKYQTTRHNYGPALMSRNRQCAR